MWYSIIQYVHDPLRQERVNIGLMVWDGEDLLTIRITRITQKVRSLYPDVDLEEYWKFLDALEARLSTLHVSSIQMFEETCRRAKGTLYLTSPLSVQLSGTQEEVVQHLYARLVG